MSNHEPFVPWMHSLLDRMKELYNKPNARTIAEALPDITGAMHYRGTKAAVADLPSSGNATGDFWHITADGSEWAWDGSEWQNLGSVVDLSAYRTAAAQDLIDATQNTAIAAKYTKPNGGIPKTDLSSAVQTSLDKADTALQSYTETDPTVPAWAKAVNKPTYTAQEVGALPDTTAIPVVPTSDINANTAARHTHSNKSLLDTYTQTEVNLADAVSKKHTHSNKTVLDGITAVKLLPAVTSSDNDKFLRVVSGAWAAATVPSAETASF